MSPAEGRLDVASGEVRHSRSSEVERVLALFADFHEVLADGCSRRQYRNGEPHQHARFDHVCTKSLVRGLVDDGCHARYLAPVRSRHMMSDHSPIEVRFVPPPVARRTMTPPW